MLSCCNLQHEALKNLLGGLQFISVQIQKTRGRCNGRALIPVHKNMIRSKRLQIDGCFSKNVDKHILSEKRGFGSFANRNQKTDIADAMPTAGRVNDLGVDHKSIFRMKIVHRNYFLASSSSAGR